jgi:Fe2+ or Zn2+ uptake regulation protein
VDDVSTDYAAEVRAAGLRVTSGRAVVLETLAAVPHTSAEGVLAQVIPRLPGTSAQSVYNILNDLTRVGLVRRFEPAGSAALYERQLHDNHHHLVCTRCGKIADVDCVVGEAPCLVPADPQGFAVAQADVTFYGLCADCQAEVR